MQWTADISLVGHLIVLIAGLLAGFVDAIAGGGGLITVPALLAVGLPPHLALGTNKLQSVLGVGTALRQYRGSGLVRVRDWWLSVACTSTGAVAGTAMIQRLSPTFLTWAIPLMLVAILGYTLASPDLGARPARARVDRRALQVAGGLVLGFHDGFFGPGTGAFWALALVTLAGLDLRRATAATKVMNLTSNATALVVFTCGGQVVLSVGLAMGAGQIIGSVLGARQVVRRSPGFVRWFLIASVGLTLAKLVRDQILAG
ncbi:MAG TPA: TSUP family transporter [Candidatus Krumholzibacteria bacterium]|nr:TSUP family transporter [Candidatus Krumholzibacteria bacterium]HPD73067.1 TSUP family transporter [Candidatus Krumholzibacteria bacterium]HRY41867.1 TSUP family transporter [Candidatus Krumholzibacteria bacterium]